MKSEKIVKIKNLRTKLDKSYSKNKKVIYKETNNFNLSLSGEFREAFMVCDDGDYALLYHPSFKGFCASYEICKLTKKGYWKSSKDQNYINC